MRDDYTDSVAADAANKVRAGVRGGAGRMLNACRGAFPNDLGNYHGKRKEKPRTVPLTANERFYLLCAAYHTFRQRKRLERVARRLSPARA